MVDLRRRYFVTLLASAAAWPLGARAQQQERARRIGVLMGFGQGDSEGRLWLASFTQSLQGLGWSEDRNTRIDVRWSTSNIEQQRAFAKELVDLQPDVILSHGTPATTALRRETRAIPIVFA